MVKGQKSVGRKKVPIKRIDNEEARQVSFSKRRQGLFNKAHELSILCGAMVGVVVFSISGKPYSIGHPSVDAVINRFLAPNPPNVPDTSGGANQDGGGMTDTLRLFCEQYTELQGLVEEEMKRKKSLQEAIDKEMGGVLMQWLTAKICDLKPDDLQGFYKELQAIRDVVLAKANQVTSGGRQIRNSQPQPPSMDIGTTSQQYLFGKPNSQPHPAMDIPSSSQYQFGEQSTIPRSIDVPSSANGFIDGIEVNDPLLSNIYGFGGSGNFPNNQNLG
ncbi:hypothetical protein QOZ80_7AG0566950 [Eleusine coracana subsp. coracana]|nr:hypothetical protein QOZ80_7AG0566950 [Eleusine coracana subsp. coracana]